MPFLILTLFIILPLAELYFLIKLGGLIGAIPTIILLIVKAGIGAWLLRRQGLSTLDRATDSLSKGQPPIGPMFDGLGLIVAGAFLMTPGLITDTIGLVLLIPPLRRWLVARVLTRGTIVTTWTTSRKGPSQDPTRRPPSGEGTVIEGEFERLDEKTIRPDNGAPKDSPWSR